jgi:hypothetical protein
VVYVQWGSFLYTTQQKNKMVRLKRAFEISVLKNLTIRFNGYPETDCWVAILKTAVAFNSLKAAYDGFYYKNEVYVISCRNNKLDLQLTGWMDHRRKWRRFAQPSATLKGLWPHAPRQPLQ